MAIDENTKNPDLNSVSSYRLSSWMTDLHSQIKHLRLPECSLPSAHNAPMDKEITHSDSYNACQDYPITQLLEGGVRVLDIRLKYFPGGNNEHPHSGLRGFHGEIGRDFGQIMLMVIRFLTANPGEIVILDIHDMIENDNSNAPRIPYKLLHWLIITDYGSRLIPYDVSLTIEQIKTRYPGRNLIFATPDELWTAQLADKEPPRDRTYFWDKIPHKWIGKDVVGVSEVMNYIQTVINNPPVSKALWSISATAFGTVNGPIDFIKDLKVRFSADGEWQLKSNIVSFDWSLRESAAMCRQCIEANINKPVKIFLKITSPAEGEIVDHANPIVKGIATPNATVALSKVGTWLDWGRGIADSKGDFEIRSKIPFGNIELSNRLEINGWTSWWFPEVKFKIEKAPVSPPVSPPVILWPEEGSTLTTTKPNISGTGVPGATVHLYSADPGGNSFGTVLVRSNKTWSTAPVVPFPVGAFRLTCTQVLNGRESDRSKSVMYIISNKPKSPRVSVSVQEYLVNIRLAAEDRITDSYVYGLRGAPEKSTAAENVVIDGLSADTTYELLVYAVSSEGVRSEEVVVSFKTAVVDLRKPTDLKIASVVDGKVVLEWKPPVVDAEKLDQYQFVLLGVPINIGNVTRLEFQKAQLYRIQSLFKDGSTSSVAEVLFSE